MMNNMYNPGKPDMGGAIGQAAMGTMPQGQPQTQNTGIVPPQMQGQGYGAQGLGGQGFGGQWMQNHPGFGQRFGQGFGQGQGGFGFGQGFGFGGGFQPGQGFGGGGSVAQNMGMGGGQDWPGQFGAG